MEFKRLERQYFILKAKEDKTQDENFEWDVVASIYAVLDCISAFDKGSRKITRSVDLGELIHWLDCAKHHISHAMGYFDQKQE